MTTRKFHRAANGTLVGTWQAAVVGFIALLSVSTSIATETQPVAHRALVGHRDNVYAIAISARGEWLVSASEDMSARVWDWRTGRIVAQLELEGPVYEAAFSPDGRWLATADGDAKVHLYELNKFRRVRTCLGHTGPVYALAFSPDSKWLATGGGEKDHACRIWDPTTGKCLRILQGHSAAIYGVAFADGDLLATASGDKTARLWSWKTGQFRELRGHTSYVYRCRFSPDGRYLATASHDRSVRVWDCLTAQIVQTLQVSRQPVYAIAFARYGRWLACVGEEHEVRIVDWKAGKIVETLHGQNDAVYSVVWFSADKQDYLAFGGAEGKIVLLPRSESIPKH